MRESKRGVAIALSENNKKQAPVAPDDHTNARNVDSKKFSPNFTLPGSPPIVSQDTRLEETPYLKQTQQETRAGDSNQNLQCRAQTCAFRGDPPSGRQLFGTSPPGPHARGPAARAGTPGRHVGSCLGTASHTWKQRSGRKTGVSSVLSPPRLPLGLCGPPPKMTTPPSSKGCSLPLKSVSDTD